MDKLQCMEAFVRVAQSGSFIQAAEQLGVARSVVSTRIQQLEKFVDAPLFHRNTRSVRLSDIGAKYYDECVDLLKRFDVLVNAMALAKNDLTGKLRIHLVPGFGLGYFSKKLSLFTHAYTDIELDLVVSDKVVDPVSAGFDVAFQIFPPKGESLVDRKIFHVNRVFCASPEFIEKYGKPDTPYQLSQFEIGYYSDYPERNRLKFLIDGKLQEIPVSARIQSTSIHLLHDFAETGGGIVCLPTIVAKESLLEGRLVSVLTDYPLPAYSLRAVFPPNSKNIKKVRRIIDFLSKNISRQPEWDEELIAKGCLSPLVASLNEYRNPLPNADTHRADGITTA
ncbi:LysR family transcriptional regulator [Neisseria montereyensis]|uniref:LysR family transcriptional regulator n=1 Tax=Neisseria montereyensis TaxID=2973938 RepID=A0ABT2FAS6_9NEIS|nr:LysR family transcriptional regulator [Neisseria montereyensis]MCS4533200.1 LysR family transcriptional regulator [Neisseria montereyensis]